MNAQLIQSLPQRLAIAKVSGGERVDSGCLNSMAMFAPEANEDLVPVKSFFEEP
jgi:hypothetical protein